MSGPLGSVLSVLLLLAGTFAAGVALYLLILAVAASFSRRTASTSSSCRHRLAVLIPAYNEAELIERCVTSLVDQTYPSDRYEIIVIADNCTDETAAIALRAGAQVMVRVAPDARGKGRALRWAMDRILSRTSPPDGIVVVDADSVADPGLLAGLVAAVEHGAEVVQGEYLVLQEQHSPNVDLRAAAILLFHRARFAGRAALGMPCTLVGNGMLFAGRVLRKQPWNAFSAAEDLEYSMNLRLAGVKPRFAQSAVVRGPMPASDRVAEVQRQRWEGGRLHVMRTAFPRLARAIVFRGRWSLLDAVIDLAVPPLGLLVAGTLGGCALAASLGVLGITPLWLVAPYVLALTMTAAFVVVGLHAADASPELYRSLLSSPQFLVKKVRGTLQVLKSARADTWVRTERPSESGS